ncbi:MAG: ATPase, T2SS/T4P/T4SS family [Thermofilaceae archaeon]
MSYESRLKRTLLRIVPVSREELEVTEIVSGQPLSELPGVLGLTGPTTVIDLSSPSLAGVSRKYIPPRPCHAFTPLNQLAAQLGLEIYVRFYEISGIPIYFVTEPQVTDLTKRLYVYFKSKIGELGVSSRDLVKFISEEFEDLGISPKYALGDPAVKAAVYYLWRDLYGYGPLEIPMEDPDVEEVSWFHHDSPVEVVDREVGSRYPNAEFVLTNIFIPRYVDEVKKKYTMGLITRSIASRGKVGLTIARPLVETRIPDPSGFGFHRLAAHSDVTGRSYGLTIRKFPQVKLNLARLISFGSLNGLMAAYLLLQLLKRGFVMIVGGMASGKTTLLQALISALPLSYKVITVEDTPELSTPSHNWHPLYVRPAPKASELEDISFSRLVIHGLRHRGTIVTLGEARGEEFAYLIQAAASGHGAICLRPNAVVIVKVNGRSRLVELRELEGVIAQSGDLQILSYDLVRGVAVWRRLTGLYRVHAQRWVRIRTASGRVIEATPDHRLPVASGGRVVVKPAEQVAPGDELLLSPPAPLEESNRSVVVDGVYVELTRSVGRIVGGVLASGWISGRGAVLPRTPELEESAYAVARAYGATVRVTRRRIYVESRFISRVIQAAIDALASPLSLPREFAHGLADVLRPGTVVMGEPRLLHGVHYALRAVGVESAVSGVELRVLGNLLLRDPVVEVLTVEEPGEAYDVEVEDTHTFVTDNSVVSMNCTFHAHDPFSLFARITAPPINAAPESLRLITSVAYISQTKTFARGYPETVRRVVKVYELGDVQKLRAGDPGGFTVVFEWNPLTDAHSPGLRLSNGSGFIEDLLELWSRSNTLRTLGAGLYSDAEASRVLADLVAIATFLQKQAEEKVYDMKAFHSNITKFYLEMDTTSAKIWELLKSTGVHREAQRIYEEKRGEAQH